MKRSIIFSGLLLGALAGAVLAYERLQGPTELIFCDKTKAFNGYTLFGAGNRSFLLDLDGRVVHTWPVGTSPHLLENGNVLDAAKDDPSGFGGFKEVDWDGKTIWEYTEKRENYRPHHDWVRIFNKKLNAPTTLYIANKSISNEQAIAAGADPKKGPYRDGEMDAVVEVDMQGNVVWEWWFFDHVVQDVDPAKPNYTGAGKTIANYRGRLNINLPGRPLRADWLHCNSMDYNAELGHVVINSVQGELYVIDHDGTFISGDPKASIAKAAGPAGDFLYRFGDPARYGQGDPPRVLENWDSATPVINRWAALTMCSGSGLDCPARDICSPSTMDSIFSSARRNLRFSKSTPIWTPMDRTPGSMSIRQTRATGVRPTIKTRTICRGRSRSKWSGTIVRQTATASSAISDRALSVCPTGTHSSVRIRRDTSSRSRARESWRGSTSTPSRATVR
jgi:hypothetical protein